MSPFERASLTGCETSTVKVKAMGIIGIVKKPAKPPFNANRGKFLDGSVYYVRDTNTNIATKIVFKLKRYFLVRSRMGETTNAPASPDRRKLKPIILASFDEYPYGRITPFISAPNPV